MNNSNYELVCPSCGSNQWDLANVGLSNAILCLHCAAIYNAPCSMAIAHKKPWVEITKGQIDDCLKHSDNYDFAWAIEHICKQNNGY